jgi:hypothetical protein
MVENRRGDPQCPRIHARSNGSYAAGTSCFLESSNRLLTENAQTFAIATPWNSAPVTEEPIAAWLNFPLRISVPFETPLLELLTISC